MLCAGHYETGGEGRQFVPPLLPALVACSISTCRTLSDNCNVPASLQGVWPPRASPALFNRAVVATNSAGHCSSTVNGNIILDPGTRALINTALLGGTPLSSGAGKIVLTKSTGFAAKDSVTASSSGAFSGYLPGATGHETIDIYKRDPMIYLRERY